MEWLVDNVRKYKKIFIILFSYTALLYSVFMIHLLTNVGDGFWQQNYYLSGDVEMASGRWLWPYLDRLVFGVHIDPLTSLLSIAVFVISYIVVLMALDVKNTPVAVIGGLICFSGPIFSSVMAYRFMSFAYAMACFLACLGALCCIRLKNNIAAVLCAALSIACFMGLYQSYLGTFCIVGVMSLLCLCFDEDSSVKDIVTRMVRFLVSVPVGGVLYFIVLKINLALRAAELSEYNGVGNITVGSIIMSLPKSLVRTVRILVYYAKGHVLTMGAMDERFRITLIYHLIFGALLAGLVVYRILRIERDKVLRFAVTAFCFVLIPIGCNIAIIIAPDAGFSEQMAMPLVLMSALLPVVIFDKLADAAFSEKTLLWSKRAMVLICAIAVYSQSMQVLIDHSAMQEGYTATRTLTSGVLADFQKQGLLNTEKKFFFIGTPSRNETFYVTEVFDKANAYARIGDFWLTGSCMCGTYKSLFNRVMGVDIKVLSDDYESKAFDEYYESVPCYPNEGYILDWDTVIVKISDP